MEPEPASAIGHHEAARHVPGAVEVEVDHGAPPVVGDGGGQGRELAAGVVDEEVDLAVGVVDDVAQRVDLIGLADVGGNGEAAAAAPRRWRPPPRPGSAVRPAIDDVATEAGQREAPPRARARSRRR